MKKNQKYTQSDMYHAISQCDKQGKKYSDYCKTRGIPYASFKYWVTKYRLEHSQSLNGFVPVNLKGAPIPLPSTRTIETQNVSLHIHYPNGVSVNCPATVDIECLKALIKF